LAARAPRIASEQKRGCGGNVEKAEKKKRRGWNRPKRKETTERIPETGTQTDRFESTTKKKNPPPPRTGLTAKLHKGKKGSDDAKRKKNLILTKKKKKGEKEGREVSNGRRRWGKIPG